MHHKHSLLLVVVLGLFPTTGCSRKPTALVASATSAPQITVAKLEKRAVKLEVEQPGTIQAFEETALFSKLSGYVGMVAEDPDKLARLTKNTAKNEWPEHDRFIEVDSRVKKNQVLAVLAIPELDQEWKQKEALVRQAAAEFVQAQRMEVAARANVALARAAITEAEAGEERAQALYESWQKEFDRVAKLVTGGVGDSQTKDETQNQFKAAAATRKEAAARVISARASATKAEADRDKAAADIDGAQARIDVARAEADRVKALRGYLEIKAPYDGVVTRRAVNPGDLVSATEKVPLFRVARIDPVRAVVSVPETQAGLVAVGQEVRLALQGAPGQSQTGKVSRTSWSLEPASRTLRTEIDLPNEKGLLRPGMYVYAKLTMEFPAEWAVPVAAVGKVNDEPVIYLVEGGKAVKVPVQLLRGDDKFTQVRRYKKPGAADWTDPTGSESVASPAAAITDGQTVP